VRDGDLARGSSRGKVTHEKKTEAKAAVLPDVQAAQNARRESLESKRAGQARTSGTGDATAKQIAAGGRVAFDSWVREAGYAANALVPAWVELKEHQKTRWCRVAKDVFDAMTK
jgi:hypothetical protein